MEEHVSREQFPLTLAWALTHWKAQGMNLRRARVNLGQRAAGTAGVGFVASSRVRHPRHLVYEKDLPEWEVFQGAMHTARFRGRRRFELRLQAAASRTLRRYGFCAADRWSKPDAARAEQILRRLKARGDLERASLLRSGRPTGPDAWLWPPEGPDYDALMAEACAAVGPPPDDGSAEACAERSALLCVAERLRGEYHMPDVREALGALIPEELNPRLDGRKPRGRPGPARSAWG